MNPNEVLDISLTRVDVANLLNLLARSNYSGLQEAEVAVMLKVKLQQALAAGTQGGEKPAALTENDVE